MLFILLMHNSPHEQIQEEKKYGIVLFAFSFLIFLYGYIGNLLEHKHIHFIHETGVGIIIGFLAGLGLYFTSFPDLDFMQNLFFYGLLPPMIFSGGYNLKKSTFFKNFSYISLFGALGTVITFGIIFGLTFLINHFKLIRQWGNISTQIVMSTALIIKYSATICASDSVAALTMIKPNKYPKLFSIVFGEGMVNDAVAIILFHVVGKIFDQKEIEDGVALIIIKILGNFLLNVLSSLFIGGACALICTIIFKKSQFLAQNPVAEVTLLYIFGTMSYALSEILEMSGVITVLVCGVFLGHFNFYNISTTGKIATGVTFQTISFIAESLVFIYLGFTTMYYYQKETFSYTFILLELGICAFARFFTIFGLSYTVKIFRKKWDVSFYQLLIVTVAGVIRGSVAFALILTIGIDKDMSPEEKKSISVVRSSVLLMVFITTLSLGAIMPSFITGCLNQDKKSRQKSVQVNPLLDEEPEEKKPEKSGIARFDEEFLKPLFIYDYKNRKEEIKEFKKLLKLNSTEYKGGEYTGIMRASARHTLTESHFLQNKVSVYTDEDAK